MALTLDESQRMLQDSARSFIGERAPVAHLRRLRDSRDADGFDRELWREFAKMGFAGALVPGSRYRRDARVAAVMVEVNRGLYLREDDATPLPEFADVARRVRACCARALASM